MMRWMCAALLAACLGAGEKQPVKQGLVLWLDAGQEKLADGAKVGDLRDLSGGERRFAQANVDAQPRYVAGESPAIRFDGENDHLVLSGKQAALKSFTMVIVAAPRTNKGEYRAFLAAHESGKNDFETGFNIDQGRLASNEVEGFDQINVEGKGFGGERNLLEGTAPFGGLHAIAVTGDQAVKLTFDGKSMGQRERKDAELAMENMVLGARFCALGKMPDVRGFLDGDICEVLVYDRVLSDGEQTALNGYLVQKHPALAEAFDRAAEGVGQPLVVLQNPPPVQMFVPGFVVRKLPVELTNINSLRYRRDGKLMAVAYNGNVYVLSDTDGDGLEDKADLFWESNGRTDAPVGAALTPANYPHGDGLFIPCKGKLSLIVDTNKDDKADKEIVVATGWPLTFQPVDAIGVALAADKSIYFGLGTANFADAYLHDKEGKTHYDLKSERGTVMKVSPDFSKREIVCTGVRFSVGMAINRDGDLFVTDQEGATWLANGNPFDELLHIQAGRHYGFPPRHPTALPNVIDEPSVFDYAPQHQSTCGLVFNEPVNGGPTFGPESWRGDAIICGESRGKIYRTKLVKTEQGYVARNQLIGSLPMLAIDPCITPSGDLLIAAHSGDPDWGTGPTGKGTIYKVSYKHTDAPQPVLCWAGGPDEVRIAFDRPLDVAELAKMAENIRIESGRYVAAGDRFEKIRPGYAVVKRQRNVPRHAVSVTGIQITSDQRTLILNTSAQSQAINYAITLPSNRPAPGAGELTRFNTTDLAYDQTGVAADWVSSDGKTSWKGWLPHPDLSVSRAFTAGSAVHDELWALLKKQGQLTLRTSLNLMNMLRPAIQPGSRIDYTLPEERVTVNFGEKITVTPQPDQLTPIEIKVPTGDGEPRLQVYFTTAQDSRPRAMPLRRFVLPWAKLKASEDQSIASAIPEQLKGGDWLRGRAVFYGNQAACSRCHSVRGQGSDLGPDLSNLIHRDYESVVRDIREPSAALNPDHLASIVKLKNGRVLGGIVRKTDADHFLVRGDAEGERAPLAMSSIKSVAASKLSMMPTGILEGLGAEKSRDLLTFLLTQPLEPAALERKGAPPPRGRAEVEAVVKASTQPAQASAKKLRILLVAGAKDHGPSEHDYPAWQKRWMTLLSLAENVSVDQANDWPTPAQWDASDVVIFYCANGAWKEEKGKELDAHLAKGRGLIFLHMAVHGHDAPDALAKRIGLAWGPGAKFRHGALELTFRDTAHPITRGFERVKFIDESYWNLLGDAKRIHVLADAPEEGSPRPILWTVEHEGGGRVFVSLLGHYTWTFDDPMFRATALRGICWAAHEPADRLSSLATIGARVSP